MIASHVAVSERLHDETAAGAAVDGLVPPHGPEQRLTPLLVDADARADEITRAAGLPRVAITSRETSDVVMLGIGAFTPLRGFMGREDWHSVCTAMHLADGTFWPIPITVSVSREEAARLHD